MKNLKIALVVFILILGSVLWANAQVSFENDRIEDLIDLSISINSSLRANAEMSMKADTALIRWYDSSFKDVVFDYVDGDYTMFAELVDDNENVFAVMNENIRTNIGGSSMIRVAEASTTVGASYLRIYDDTTDDYFGVYLILFRD